MNRLLVTSQYFYHRKWRALMSGVKHRAHTAEVKLNELAVLPKHGTIQASTQHVKTTLSHQGHSLPLPHLYSLKETCPPCTLKLFKTAMSEQHRRHRKFFPSLWWFSMLLQFPMFHFPYLEREVNNKHTSHSLGRCRRHSELPSFLKCLKVTVSAKSGATVTLWSSLNFSPYLWNRNIQHTAHSSFQF